MNRNISKVITLLVLFAMVFTMAACGASKDNTGTTQATEATQAATTAAAAEEPPVTLKYWIAYDGLLTPGVHNDPIMQEFTKQTGVILDFEANLTVELYNAKLASGDLPDIMTFWTRDVKNLVDGGNLIDMEPLLAKYGQDIVSDKGKVEFGKQFLSVGQNKLFAIPSWSLGLDAQPVKSFDQGSGIGLYLRWDIYKEVGYPEMTGDITNIIPILKQMQDKYPTAADGKKVYGLSPWFGEWDLWNFTIYYQGYDNKSAEGNGFLDIDVRTNAMTSQIMDTNSTLWKGAKFYNKAYQAGVLDPDSLMQKYDQTVEKYKAGRALMGPCNWNVAGGTAAYAKAGHPEQGYMEIKPSSDYKMIGNLYKNPFTDRWAQAITKACREPEKAMKALNFLNSKDGMRLLLNGIEGVNWKLDSNGIPKWTDEMKKLHKEGTPQDLEAAGFGCYTHLYGYAENSWDSKYNCQAMFKFNEDPTELMATATQLQKDYTEHYKVAYPDQVMEQALPDQKVIFDGSFQQMVEPTPTDIKAIDDKLLNYLKINLVGAIPSKTDAEFEAQQKRIIDECKAMGAEKAAKWHMDAIKAAMSKMDAFCKAIGK